MVHPPLKEGTASKWEYWLCSVLRMQVKCCHRISFISYSCSIYSAKTMFLVSVFLVSVLHPEGWKFTVSPNSTNYLDTNFLSSNITILRYSTAILHG